MRPHIRSARLTALALALLVGLGACRSPTDVTRQLDVTISVDHTEISPTNPAQITIAVTNRGPHPVETNDPNSYGCSRPYQVSDAADGTLLLPRRACTLIFYGPRTLAPGETITIHDSWSAEVSDGGQGAVPVVPGQYRVVARIVSAGHEIGSEPVVVTVGPADGQ